MADPIPVSRWGRDHWSTFAYIASRVVDYDGRPVKASLLCDPKRHPIHAHFGSTLGPPSPTRLKDGELADHDDWDCLDDAEAAKLVLVSNRGVFPIYALTDYGRTVDAALRAHKAAKGTFATFVPPPAPEPSRVGTEG